MKSVYQIKQRIKNSGLTGDEFSLEFQSQCLTFGREIIRDIVIESEEAKPDFNNILVHLAHYTEIFVAAELGKFERSFAEHLLSEVFAHTGDYIGSFVNWHDKLRGNAEDVETAAPVLDAPILTETSKPKIPAPPPDSRAENLERMARRINAVLESEHVSETVKDAIYSIADNAVFETESAVSRTSFIETRFANAMYHAEQSYSQAVMTSLFSVMENCIDDKIYHPINSEIVGR